MMDTITNRRAYLERKVEAHRSAILLHESELRAERAEMIVIVGRLAELDFVVAAYADRDANAEAGACEAEISGTPQGGEQTMHSAGTGSDPMVSGAVAFSEPKKPRALSLGILRGMVLDDVKRVPGQTIWQLAEALGEPVYAVNCAVAYWRDKGKLLIVTTDTGDQLVDIIIPTGAQGAVSGATPAAPEAKIAPVGTGEALSDIVPKKPRAGRRLRPYDTKRDIRGMVLEYVEHYSGGNLDQDQIWRLLGVSPRAVASAVAYWQAKGRLTVDGEVVRLRMEGEAVEPQQSEAAE